MIHNYLNSADIIFKELKLNTQRRVFKSDLEKLEQLKNQLDLDLNLDQVILNNYDALVLTDCNQVISWVNKGFVKMTGYTSEEAIGKRPSFLQGPKTCEKGKAKLKEGIRLGRQTKSTLINYRKTGATYECQISIVPLKNSDDKITHFLAIEKEIS